MYKSIALVDLSYIVARHYHAPGAKDGSLDDIGEAICRDLSKVRGTVEHTILCLDAPPYWRTKEYPEYKAQRPVSEDGIVALKRWVLERVRKDGYPLARVDGFEADDVAATLALNYSSTLQRATVCDDVRIVSSDKDCSQCITERVSMLVSTRGGGLAKLDPAGVKSKFGVLPKDMPLWLALVGDPGDNIPGFEGVGPKTASEWIEAAGGDLIKLREQAVTKVTQLGAKAPKVVVNFVKRMLEVEQWLRLTRLRCDVPINSDLLLAKIAPEPLVEEQPDLFGDELPADPEPNWDAIEEQTEAAIAEENTMDLISPPPPRLPSESNVEMQRRAAERTPQEIAALTGMVKPEVDPFARAQRNAEPWPRETMNVSPASQSIPPPKAPLQPPPLASDTKMQNLAMSHLPTPQEFAALTGMIEPPKAVQSVSASPSKEKTSTTAETTSQGRTTATSQAAPTSSTHATEDAGTARVVRASDGPPKPRKGEEIESTALAVRPEAPSWALALQPATAREALDIAKVLFNSRMYSQFGSERGVFAIIMLGRELGLGIAQALQGFYNVKDKPFASAALIRSLAEGDPNCEWFRCTHSDNASATWETRHRKWPEGVTDKFTYTIEEAKLAELTTGQNKHNWLTKPRSMLEKTAGSKLARRCYPRAVLGLHCIDEIGDE